MDHFIILWMTFAWTMVIYCWHRIKTQDGNKVRQLAGRISNTPKTSKNKCATFSIVTCCLPLFFIFLVFSILFFEMRLQNFKNLQVLKVHVLHCMSCRRCIKPNPQRGKYSTETSWQLNKPLFEATEISFPNLGDLPKKSSSKSVPIEIQTSLDSMSESSWSEQSQFQ